MQGLVDVNSIEWLEPDVQATPRDNVLTYNNESSRFLNWGLSLGRYVQKSIYNSDKAQKIYCDLQRICEIEDTVVEWYDSKYFQRPQELLNVDFLHELF
mmetsp:Transcript_7380/g.6630  ORF Transcript_7380/g.6630 Transcript_7380/m.6630 type:complete len:99 (+) Transcript_7380:1994-2290(+)